MVNFNHFLKNKKIVEATLTINETYDIINGLLILIDLKEQEINQTGEQVGDKEQLDRYKQTLKDMQKIKEYFTG